MTWTRDSKVGLRGVAAAMAIMAAILLAAFSAPLASAETTHKFIKDLTLPVGGLRLLGVDPQGNLVVLSGGTVRKYSSSGEPVDFSALGTNVIDGAGGGDCPSTPSDCDEIPYGELGGPTVAAMNQSTSGPTAGYMYVAAHKEVEPGVTRSHVVVFDPAGRYVSQIDTGLATPLQSPEAPPYFISVSPGGSSIIVTYSEFAVENSYHADKYQAVNADPADDVFVGQLRKTGVFGSNELAGGGFGLGAVADDSVVYVGRGAFLDPSNYHPVWELYDAASFSQPTGDSKPVNLDPNHCECDTAGPFGDGGRNEETGGYFGSASIDPKTHHVYLLDGPAGQAEEWASPSEKVGPTFGSSETIGFASGQMAFDTSGIASTDGRIYISKGNSIAVFSPPVPIPNIEAVRATAGHSDAQVSATVDLDHGPNVTDCRVQWGEEQPEQPVFYTQFVPCEPPAPYAAESTQITAHLTGLATESSYRVRVVVKTNNGVNRSAPIKIHPAAVLSLETEPASGITRTTALLNGSLDPDGMPTTYWFEYGIDTGYRQKTPEGTAGPGGGSAPVAPMEIDNLQPGRLYHFRLVANNGLGTTHGEDRSFVAAAAPTISGVRPSNVAETSATLNARIDPGGFPTTYRFEYGPTTSYDHVIPVGGGSVGEGSDPVEVSADLSGLESGVTYHFRVVATNKWGTESTDDATFDFFPQNCPNAYARQLTRAAYLPDCRAYELVSPGNAGAVRLYPGDVTQDLFFFRFGSLTIPHMEGKAMNLGTASSPARFSFLGMAGTVSGTNPPNSLIDTYTASRTVSGWTTRYWGQKGNEVNVAGGAECDLGMDTCIDYHLRELFNLSGDPNDLPSSAPYVWDSEGHSLGRWPTNMSVVKNAKEYIGDDRPSPDFSHYVFSSVNIPFTVDGLTGAPGSVYDNNIEDGTVTKVSLLSNGGDLGPGEGGEGSSEEFVKIPAVSTDGSHILMTTHAVGGPLAVNLFMRVDDSVTYEIAKGAKGIRLIGMTSDGSKVVFSTPDHVTADDTDNALSEDIYVWEEATEEVRRVSQGNGGGNSDECEPPQGNLCSVTPLQTERLDSDDPIAATSGDVYFYSPEQLDPNSPGVFNEKNLYVYRHGAVKYVATLNSGTAINRIQISPDGSHVAFLTAARLTSYDNQGWRELYTFNPDTGVVRCASCIPTGEPPTVVRPPEDPISPFASEASKLPSRDVTVSQSGRFMSDDGRTAFATSDALVEGDTDGLVDVYEFVGGRPQLISSGTAQNDLLQGNRFFPGEYTGLEAISRDGIDIYFSTYDTMAPTEDFNGQFLKFYDARTGGGFPPPPAHLPCGAADECHGAENPGPETPAIGTAANLGAAAGSRRANGKKPKKHRHKHARRHRRGKKSR